MTLSPNFTWYRCSDGKYMTVCALAANQWEHFCDAVERPDLKEAWATMRGNMYRGSELHEQIQKEVFDTNTREYWSAPASSQLLLSGAVSRSDGQGGAGSGCAGWRS